MFYSVVIPVYNRPDEIEDLLQCFTKQTYKNFEVLIIESGSSIKSDRVVAKYEGQLNVQYHFKGNDGQGFSRNYGFARAKGDYFIVLDSDVLLDNDFIEKINNSLSNNYIDAYGGPDRLHPNSTKIQKAVNYCLTSVLTTGGIRGNKNHVGKFYPRSFNMGFSRKVYEATNGYKLPFFGEDIELSARIMSLGFSTGLIEEAHVYHKRKNNFRDFYRQMNFFGRSRINIYLHFPDTLKLVHFFPAAFFVYMLLIPFMLLLLPPLGMLVFLLLLIYFQLIFMDAGYKNQSLRVGVFAVLGVIVQMSGYGIGFIVDYTKRVIFKMKV